jgi:hypothetical protein
MGFKIKVCLTVIIVILILLTVKFYTLSIKEIKKKDEEKLPEKIHMDNPSVIPFWRDGEYHDYSGTTKMLNDFNKNYPDLVDVYSIGKSVKKRDIWCIRVTNEQNRTRKYSCLIDGCIHGNEWEAGEACLYLTEYLLINYGFNNTVSKIMNTTEVYLVPMLNPDGRQKDDRYNDNGVDLNRNFNVHFGRIRGKNYPLGKLFGFIKIPALKIPGIGIFTNCGRRPFSEPETKAIRDFMKSLGSKDFSFYVNCHTAIHCIGGPSNVNYKPEYKVTQHEREVINGLLDWTDENTEYLPIYGENYNAIGIGAAMDWFFKEFRVPSYTFEILSKKYEPGFFGGGPHDRLVHWMKTTLPVFLYLLVNIENLHNWDIPDIEPFLPEGVPPPPLEKTLKI